jgi:hypothetical protein
MRLIEDPLIRERFSILIYGTTDISEIAICMSKLENINKNFISSISENVNIDELIDKLNQSSAFGISIFILIIKGINLRLIKEVIRRLDIKRIAKKIKDNNIYNIASILMAFFNVDSTIASNLVNEMLKDNDIKIFLDIMYNEGTIFINSLILFYIACANKNVATRLITEFDINLIIEKIESDDDFVGFQTFLMTSNILLIKDNKVLMDITPTGFGKIVVILKRKNVLDNSHFVWSLALANKKIAHKLIKNNEYISYLINAIEKEGNLVEVGTLIIWIAYINKEIAENMIRAVDTDIFLEKIHNAEKIDNINYFLMSLAYVDKRLAVEYYMFQLLMQINPLLSD